MAADTFTYKCPVCTRYYYSEAISAPPRCKCCDLDEEIQSIMAERDMLLKQLQNLVAAIEHGTPLYIAREKEAAIKICRLIKK